MVLNTSYQHGKTFNVQIKISLSHCRIEVHKQLNTESVYFVWMLIWECQ